MNEDLQIPERMLLQEAMATGKIGAGLMNRGNTCFVNSVLQCLTHTTPLVNYLNISGHSRTCQTEEFCMLCELHKHIQKSFVNSYPISPESILQNIKLISRHLTLGRQEDAHEFLIFILNAMERCATTGIHGLDQPNGKHPVVEQIFGGIYKSQVECLQCHGKSTTLQEFFDISLEIKNVKTLDDAISNFFKQESLGDDAYSCAKCDQKVPAIKGVAINKAPNVLTVSLQRFDFMYGKMAHHVKFAERLDLKPYMSSTQGESILYELYAVVVHSGQTCTSGHYYAYIRSSLGNWYLINDSKVKPVPVCKALSSQAYLLFYKKCRPSDIQKNKPGSSMTDIVADGGTGEPNIVESMSPAANSSRGTLDRPVDGNGDETASPAENRASTKKRAWDSAFSEEFDDGKMNACSTNKEDPLPAHGPATSPARKKLKCSRVKFVGRRICHEWLVDEVNNTSEWYYGTVLRATSGRDGGKSTVYDVLYDGEEECYSVDHLLEDFASSSVRFVDI